MRLNFGDLAAYLNDSDFFKSTNLNFNSEIVFSSYNIQHEQNLMSSRKNKFNLQIKRSVLWDSEFSN